MKCNILAQNTTKCDIEYPHHKMPLNATNVPLVVMNVNIILQNASTSNETLDVMTYELHQCK